MPKYINSGSKTKAVGNKMVQPGETVETTVYINIPDMTLVTHQPYVQENVLLSHDYAINPNSSEIIAIPHPGQSGKYALDVFFIDKPVNLYLDMSPTAKAIKIDTAMDYGDVLRWDFCAYIKITNPSVDTVANVRVMVSRY